MNLLNLKLGKILGINLMICTLLLSGCSSDNKSNEETNTLTNQSNENNQVSESEKQNEF